MVVKPNWRLAGAFMVVLLIAITALVTPAAADVDGAEPPGQLTVLDRGWIPPQPSQLTDFTTRYVINDTYLESWGWSRLVSSNTWDGACSTEWNCLDSAVCTSYEDSDCTRGIHFHNQLPLCDDSINTNCVAGLTARLDGQAVETTFSRYVDTSGPTFTDPIGEGMPGGAKITAAYPASDFLGDSERGLPPGGRVSLWSAEGVADANQDSFLAVDVVMSGYRNEASGEVEIWSFHASVLPLVANRKANPSPHAPTLLEGTYPDGRRTVSHTGGGGSWLDTQCRYFDRAHCLQVARFPAGVSFTMDLRLTNNIAGWLHGRLDEPSVVIREVNQNTNAVSISGRPVTLPMAVQDVKDSDMSEDLGSPQWWKDLVGRPQLWTWNLFADGEFRLTWFQRVLPYFKDRSDFEVDWWAVRGVFRHEARCMTSKSELLGLVTTNAMMYSGLPPSFESGRLTYRVAGLHERPDGSTTRGTYDLIMRKSVAQCLYGLADSPLSAEVSVISEDGTEQVATTSVAERDGWIIARATNFTFSSPRIEVTFNSPEPISIVCVKKSKKIKGPKRITITSTDGVAPRCPKGYRKQK